MKRLKTVLLLTVLFFTAVFFFFTSPIGRTDFWWHLNTGKWIATHGSLPQEDPFAYTTPAGPDDRKTLILKGYWLSQTAFYTVHRLSGFGGLVVFKGLLFTLLFYILFRSLLRGGLDPFISMALIAPVVLLSARFEDVRPQVFSFIGALLVFDLIEAGLAELRAGLRPKALMLLAPVMLLWANLHKGFIVGYAVIGAYMLAETLKRFLNPPPLPSYGRFLFYLSSALGASLLNPTHIMPLSINLPEIFGSPLVETTNEFMPPWRYAAEVGDMAWFYGLLAVSAVTLASIAVSLRRLSLPHALLYAGFAVAGMWTFRFSIFFMLISVAISGRYSLRRLSGPLRKLSMPLAVLLCIAIFLLSYDRTFIRKGALNERSLPVEAADFIGSYKPPAPIFNPYEWGGYLSWRLYPDYKVFVDARTINMGAHMDYKRAKFGDTAPVFDKYGINTVVFYYINPLYHDVPIVVISLLRDDAWQLRHIDRLSAIFVRKGQGAPAVARPLRKGLMGKELMEGPPLNKEVLIDRLRAIANSWAARSPEAAGPYIILGELSYASGDTDKAIRFFGKALELEPENKRASAWLSALRY